MGFIMEGILFLMMCIMGLMILGIALSPLYWVFCNRKKVWEFIYNKIPEKHRILLRAKFKQRVILKKIRQLHIGEHSHELLNKIDQLVCHDLVQLLKNRAILKATIEESDSDRKFHEQNKSAGAQKLGKSLSFFRATSLETNSQIDQIMLFLDSLSLSLSELQIKGLPSGEQIGELISNANNDIARIIRSEEEVASLQREEDTREENASDAHRRRTGTMT